MRGEWVIPASIGDLVFRADDRHPTTGSPVSPWVAQRELTRAWERRDTDALRAWARLARSLAVFDADTVAHPAVASHGVAVDRLVRALQFALASKRLYATRRMPMPARGELAAQGEVTASEATPAAAAWIALRLLDQDGEPIPRRGFRVVAADGQTLEGFLDDEGAARLSPLASGSATVTLTDLDAADRQRPSLMAGPGAKPAGLAQNAGLSHLVQPGDTIASIASRYGFLNGETLWNHRSNEALRAASHDPLCLPADVPVGIPSRVPFTLSCATEEESTIVVWRSKLELRLRLVDPRGQPRAGVACTVAIGDTPHTVTTDGDGLLKVPCPADATAGELRIGEGAPRPIAIGHLEPTSTPAGVSGRFANLGFCAPLADLVDEGELELRNELRALATERLQRRLGKPIDGVWSEDLEEALRKEAGV
jgi:hypothetical protein